jgi:pilus assembly protein Flp/PilA
MKKLSRFIKDEDGVTSLEYGLIAAAICTALAAAMTALTPVLKGVFTTIQGQL